MISQSLLVGSTTVTWRKIDRVALFVDGGETVRTVIAMADTTANLRTGGVPSLTASTATASTHAVDPSRGAPKLHVNVLKEFDGQPISYKEWERGFKATLVQTAYATLITTPPTTGDTIMETRYKELFFILNNSLLKRSGMHIINTMIDESRYQAIQDIDTWYGSAPVILKRRGKATPPQQRGIIPIPNQGRRLRRRETATPGR